MQSEPWFPVALGVAVVFLYVLGTTAVAVRHLGLRPATRFLVKAPAVRPPRGMASVELGLTLVLIAPIEIIMIAYLVEPEHLVATRLAAIGQFVALAFWTYYLIRLARSA